MNYSSNGIKRHRIKAPAIWLVPIIFLPAKILFFVQPKRQSRLGLDSNLLQDRSRVAPLRFVIKTILARIFK